MDPRRMKILPNTCFSRVLPWRTCPHSPLSYTMCWSLLAADRPRLEFQSNFLPV